MSAPTLVKRLIKGSEVTPAEGDANLQALSDYTEAVETLYLEEHNADGTHKYPGTVRGVVTGTVNTPATAQVYNVTVEGTYSTLADLVGITIVARIDVANYYSATQPNLKVNGSSSLAGPMKKYGDQNLTPGDLRAGQEATFFCDGVNFQLVNPCTNTKQSYGVDTGSANVVTVAFTANPTDTFEVPSAYYAGYKVAVKVANGNTGAATLQISSTQNTTLAAVAIRKPTTAGIAALTGGEMKAGCIYEFMHDGTYFQLLGRPQEYTGTSGSTLAASMVHSFTHGLGAIPRKIRVVMVCGTIDNGWQVADEVDCFSFRTNTPAPSVVVGANSTTITVTTSTSANLEIGDKTSGTYASVTESSWTPKVYAEL